MKYISIKNHYYFNNSDEIEKLEIIKKCLKCVIFLSKNDKIITTPYHGLANTNPFIFMSEILGQLYVQLYTVNTLMLYTFYGKAKTIKAILKRRES